MSEGHKADPPKLHTVLTPAEALVYWVTALQTYPQYEPPSIRVKNYDGDADEYTELDLDNDDASNLTDGTWTDPIMIPADEDEEDEDLLNEVEFVDEDIPF